MGRRRAYREQHTRFDGSLSEWSCDMLLTLCQTHRLTGRIRISSWGREGQLLVRAGAVEQVSFGDFAAERALDELLALRDGMFELRQELPRLTRASRTSAGRPASLSEVAAQCHERALSCNVVVAGGAEQIALTFRAGAVTEVVIDQAQATLALEPLLERYGARPVGRVEPLRFSLRAARVVAAAAPARGRPGRRVPQPGAASAHAARGQVSLASVPAGAAAEPVGSGGAAAAGAAAGPVGSGGAAAAGAAAGPVGSGGAWAAGDAVARPGGAVGVAVQPAGAVAASGVSPVVEAAGAPSGSHRGGRALASGAGQAAVHAGPPHAPGHAMNASPPDPQPWLGGADVGLPILARLRDYRVWTLIGLAALFFVSLLIVIGFLALKL